MAVAGESWFDADRIGDVRTDLSQDINKARLELSKEISSVQVNLARLEGSSPPPRRSDAGRRGACHACLPCSARPPCLGCEPRPGSLAAASLYIYPGHLFPPAARKVLP